MGADADRRLVAGRYVLGGPLGRGGMGTVWRADDVLLGRPVAVKEVELPAGPAGADRAALRERALREARAAARLNHPGVVTLHDAVEADDRLFLVMELVDAPTLRDLVDRSGPVGHGAAARIAGGGPYRAGAAGRRPPGRDRPPRRQAGQRHGLPERPGQAGRLRHRLAPGGHSADPHRRHRGDERPWGRPGGDGGVRVTAIRGPRTGQRRARRAGPLEPALLALLAKDPAHRPPATVVRRMLEPLTAGSSPSHPTVPLAAGTSTLPSAGTTPRRRGRDPLPGWTAPPRRRRWGRRLLVAAGVLLLAVASNLGDDRRAGRGPAGLGDPVRDGQFEFVVRSVDCGARSVGEDLGRRRALGQFCMVGLRVENTGGEGRTFGGGQQYLFDDVGKRHDPDLDATFRHGNGQLLSTHLNPGQRLEGTLVYDVPDPVGLARVELHDGPFSGGVSVALGGRR